MIGKTLAHYRIIEKIGAGGMGVVWKAEDLALDRTVAIKVLPADRALSDERRAMFVQEAKLAASVSHGNIVQVFELGREADLDFIAMEFVEGQPLSELLAGRPLPPDKAADWALQVTRGLARAHGKGLIHRDLKPANILITPDGEAKIVDFGLATLFTRPGEQTLSVTETLSRTSAHGPRAAIAGTLPYMSPEQVKGDRLDSRSDIFSLGTVLYEMTTGQRPFRGVTPEEVAGQILQGRPPAVHTLVPSVPLDLDRIIEKSLARSPADRYQTTDDMAVDLKRLVRDLESGSSPSYDELARIGKRTRRPRMLPVLSVLLVAIVALVFGSRLLRNEEAPGAPVERRLTTNPADDPVGAGWGAEISPDGALLVYEARDGAYLKVLETDEIKKLTPIQGVESVQATWYPDGSRLLTTLYPEDGSPSLWQTSVLTGASLKLRDGAVGMAVSPDGQHITFIDVEERAREIWLMDASGGNARVIVSPREEDRSVTWWARWSPDSRRIAYRRQTFLDTGVFNTIETCDLNGENRTVVVPPELHLHSGIHGVWLADGRIIFSRADSKERIRDSGVWEVPVDVRTGEAEGAPRRIFGLPGFYGKNWSATRDGGQVAFVKYRRQAEIFVAAFDEASERFGPARRITRDVFDDFPLSWTPDGEGILVTSDRRGTADIFLHDVDDGTNTPVMVGPGQETQAAATADGQWTLYVVRGDPALAASFSPDRVMRVPTSGGAPEEIFRGEMVTGIQTVAAIQCGSEPESRCVLAQHHDGELVFSLLDPVQGQGPVLGSVSVGDIPRPWSLSPDGETVACLTPGTEGQGGILLLSLDTGETRLLDVAVPGPLGPPVWSPSGSHLLATAPGEQDTGGTALVRIDPDGGAAPVPHGIAELEFYTPLLPSPDGRQIAFSGILVESFAGVLEGL